MAVTRWDPFTALARIDREFEDLIRRGWGPANVRSGYVPPVEIVTEDADVVIRLELPGVDVDRDLDVTVERDRLVIRGERRDERQGQSSGVLVRELRYGSFRREFALPQGITADSVDATYDQGMLEVRVRGAVHREPEPQRIQVRSEAPKTIEARDDAIEGTTSS